MLNMTVKEVLVYITHNMNMYMYVHTNTVQCECCLLQVAQTYGKHMSCMCTHVELAYL